MRQKTALITGCSCGIGYHCARRLRGRSGWRVFASARKAEDVARLRGEGFEALRLDLRDAESITAAVDALLERTGGRLDALFNNGAYGLRGAVEDLPARALRDIFETNVFGTQMLTNAVIPAMRRAGGGRIAQNSSVLGYVSLRYRGAYVASKYALEGLSDTMRLELAGENIQVILIEPGPIESKFRANATAAFRACFDADAIAASAHRREYERWLAGDDERAPPFTLGPEAVYKALLHALEARRPRLRYRVTAPAKAFWWLKRALPTRALDGVLRRI